MNYKIEAFLKLFREEFFSNLQNVSNFRCFFRGNGGTVNVLRISGPQGYPECGTQRVS
jgi:hypothetical protein